MELRCGLLASGNVHDRLRPAERLVTDSATPAAAGPTGDDCAPVVGETALCELAADQKLGAARLEPFTDFLLKPDTFPPELVGCDDDPLVLGADSLPPRKPLVSVIGQHAANRTTELASR